MSKNVDNIGIYRYSIQNFFNTTSFTAPTMVSINSFLLLVGLFTETFWCVRFLSGQKCERRFQQLQISVFKIVILANNRFEFFH